MVGQRIELMEISSLISLKSKGLSNRKMADLLKVNRITAALNLSNEELLGLNEAQLRDLFTEESQTEKKRYEELAGYFSYFEKELSNPGCTLQVLWKVYIANTTDGNKYDEFTWHFRRWQKLSNHSAKLIHKAADKLFVDFCGTNFSSIDKSTGEKVTEEVFVAVLPCSQYTFVKAVPMQQRQT